MPFLFCCFVGDPGERAAAHLTPSGWPEVCRRQLGGDENTGGLHATSAFGRFLLRVERCCSGARPAPLRLSDGGLLAFKRGAIRSAGVRHRYRLPDGGDHPPFICFAKRTSAGCDWMEVKAAGIKSSSAVLLYELAS